MSSAKSGNESTHALRVLKECFRIHYERPSCIRSVFLESALRLNSPGRRETQSSGRIVGNAEVNRGALRFRGWLTGFERVLLHALSVMLLATSPATVLAATTDPVLDWISIMNSTVIAGGSSPLVSTRNVALVSASVFDAVNCIDPRFQPLHVKPNASHHASQRAAAIQAA
jgi:hypothetical protein